MNTTSVCNCKGGCRTRRCPCVRDNKPCGDSCGCMDCANPLNGLDVENLSICAIQHADVVRNLTEAQLETPIEMPCGHAPVPLRQLLKDYECPECEESYWFSFCWGDVAQDSCSWHCEVCRACRDWREWHCDVCNRCTYGVSLPCQHCERSGPFGF